GLADGMGRSEQFIKATAKEWQFGFFVGDRYRVSNKLTATLGLRYEYYPLMTRDGAFQFDRLDFTSLNVLLGGIGGNPSHLGVTTSKKLFAPRIGLAYQFNDKTVVRSGFGITVDPLPLARPLRGFYPLTVASNYHALQVSVNRQFSHGLMVKGAYTYSKAIDWTDDDGWAGLTWNDPNILRRNRAQAGFNTPQIFQLAYVYELPVGEGKSWAN